MQIVFSEDSFHGVSKPVFWKKKNKKTAIKLSSAELAQRFKWTLNQTKYYVYITLLDFQ